LTSIGGDRFAEGEIAAVQEVLGQEEGRFLELFHARFRRPLLIALLLMLASQFSGINAIIYYSTKIFTSAGIGVGNSFTASVIVGLVNFLFTWVAIGFVDKTGRRPLLLIGLTVQVLALACVGFMFQGATHGLPLLLAILTFAAAFAMALGPIPFILCSEIFPTRVRGRAMSLATFTIWTACYIVAQTFPVMNDSPAIGPALTFFIFSACSLGGLMFVIFLVPETKGRSLEEIEKSWQVPGKTRSRES
jgi:SP family arabinose:H+ symporter-like MFS transporter